MREGAGCWDQGDGGKTDPGSGVLAVPREGLPLPLPGEVPFEASFQAPRLLSLALDFQFLSKSS